MTALGLEVEENAFRRIEHIAARMPEARCPARAPVTEHPAVEPVLLRALGIVRIVPTGGDDDALRDAAWDVIEQDVAAPRAGLLVLVLLTELDRYLDAVDVVDQAPLLGPRVACRLHL